MQTQSTNGARTFQIYRYAMLDSHSNQFGEICGEQLSLQRESLNKRYRVSAWLISNIKSVLDVKQTHW